VRDGAALPRLELLFERQPSAGQLNGPIREAYGGELPLPRQVVYANFVSSIDGVAAERTQPRSSRHISKGDAHDRFVMGLLRATADVVVIGAGTARSHPGGSWTPDRAFPAGADAFASLRATWGLSASPHLAIVSASGELPDDPALRGVTVFTTDDGFRRLASVAARYRDVVVVGQGATDVDLSRAIDVLHAQGFGRVLTEGGPTLMGALLDADAVDELFLTVSPVIAGRHAPGRPGIVDGTAFAVGSFREARLGSIRRGGSLVFLRYELERRSRGDQ
jgi:riboflavin biosynthesis pyrimidine reductase